MLFKISNYENYILQTLLKSSYSRKLLVLIFTYFVTSTVKFHISCILCWMVSGSLLGDIFAPVAINVFLALFSNRLFKYIGTHRPQFEALADYLIDNYTPENMVIWKRYVMGSLLAYALTVGILVPIDNYLIVLATIQTATSYLICEILEHRYVIFKQYIDKFQLWWGKPKVQKYVQHIPVINNYGEDYSDIVPSCSISNDIRIPGKVTKDKQTPNTTEPQKLPDSPPITPKITTPPRMRK